MFGLTTADLLEYFVKLMIIFLILPLHEFSHAWAADKLGDYTAKYKGRLTLSPFAHIDIIGALLLFFFGFGWAKPVPVNPMHFKKPSQGMMLTALAGPASNLIAAFVGLIAWQLCNADAYVQTINGMVYITSDTMGYVMWMLQCFIMININLCVFNMLPIPPLDGSRVLSYVLPHRAQYWMAKNEQLCHIGVLLLMSTGILGIPLRFLSNLVFNGLTFLTSWIPPVLG